MLKQYRMAVIGAGCLMTALVATSLMSLENEKSTEDTEYILRAVKMIDDTQAKAEVAKINSEILTQSNWYLSAAKSAERIMPFQAEATDTLDNTTALEDTGAEMPVQTEDSSEQEVAVVENSPFDGYVLPDVDVYLNIRETPSIDGKIVGKLYVGSAAKIKEVVNGWTLITSGNVEGYVSNDYIITGKEAEVMALEEGKLVAKVTSGGLRVRKQPNLDADVLDLAAEGDTFEIVEQLDGWIGIEYSSDTVAYISADYVKSDFELGKAISIEEELAAMQAAREEAAIKAAQEAAAKERANQQNVQTASTDIATVTGASVEADYDDTYLLACLIHMEAGGEPYEGKLAVANVVLNRMKQGYGNSISEVIYARGQFSGANTGALASRLAKGPNDECVRAAQEALSGVNNIGDYIFFIALRKANYSSYSEYTIIGGHCFYKR
ncbi:MAG: SH3 domain-containing protein [Lachnospiraceae bacterium]|jgi:spore germination cell wall hydrolase CwlJ-like protein|nr:SH3 domain-containing protein [Lachnospiraceae bacterium]